MMRKVVSFLLGSGFSYSEKLPLVTDLNRRLKKINESEIIIHSSQQAWFLNGQVDNNRFLNRKERLFVQEFLEFYNTEILQPGEEFHYETFYDFYSLYRHDNKHHNEIEGFYKRFVNRHSSAERSTDCYNAIAAFNRTFNQLVASQLHRKEYHADSVEYGSGYGDYGPFQGLLRDLLETYDIKVHTLNHDLLFEFLAKGYTKLSLKFSDGYSSPAESKIFGKILYLIDRNGPFSTHKTYYVKRAHFTGKYNTPLCLYKLHGSIDSIIVYHNNEPIRVKQGYGLQDYFTEKYDKSSDQYEFVRLHDEIDPDFLSGTTNKLRYYSRDPHYKTLFQYFETNLGSSEFLVVIGYGFKDPGINEYLEKYFLSRGGKMFVIDPNPMLSDERLLTQYRAKHLQKGLSELSYTSLKEMLQKSM